LKKRLQAPDEGKPSLEESFLVSEQPRETQETSGNRKTKEPKFSNLLCASGMCGLLTKVVGNFAGLKHTQ
jgi:hypothetical protein